jgi:hypothetical protein
MFKNASIFNQNLGNWDISSALIMNGMLDQISMNVANYDKTIIAWASSPPSNINIGAKDQGYCLSDSSRTALINIHGWTFNNDVSNCCLIWDGEAGNDVWNHPLNLDQKYIPIPVNSVKILKSSDFITLYQNSHAKEVLNKGTMIIKANVMLECYGEE